MHSLNSHADLLSAAGRPVSLVDDASEASTPAPDYVVKTIQGAARLVGVPLGYLLPDPALLPDESLQFLVIDPRWVRALQRGMLSAASPLPMSDAELDAILDVLVPPQEALTGLLLHSSLVSQYPTLALRAWTGTLGVDDDPDDPAYGAVPVAALRSERLTPSTLLVVFEHTPDLIVIDEPHGMARLGVARGLQNQPVVRLRSAAATLVELGGYPVVVEVPFRGDPGAGVIDITALAASLRSGVASTPVGLRATDPAASSAGFALQLFVAPCRQRYQRGVTP